MVRRRFQTHMGPELDAESVVSLGAAFRTIWRHEGAAGGLYRGLSLNYVKTIPNVAICMSLNDVIKNLDFMKRLRS